MCGDDAKASHSSFFCCYACGGGDTTYSSPHAHHQRSRFNPPCGGGLAHSSTWLPLQCRSSVSRSYWRNGGRSESIAIGAHGGSLPRGRESGAPRVMTATSRWRRKRRSWAGSGIFRSFDYVTRARERPVNVSRWPSCALSPCSRPSRAKAESTCICNTVLLLFHLPTNLASLTIVFMLNWVSILLISFFPSPFVPWRSIPQHSQKIFYMWIPPNIIILWKLLSSTN